jgi:hypothetical protein
MKKALGAVVGEIPASVGVDVTGFDFLALTKPA